MNATNNNYHFTKFGLLIEIFRFFLNLGF